MRTFVIVNPGAGQGRALAALRTLSTRHPWLELHEASDRESVHAAVSRARDDGYDTVVAAGGDGTVSEVVNALAAEFSTARLGIIPMGTANDFAKTIGIPLDVERASELLVGGAERRIDLIHVSSRQDRWVINAVSGGLGVLADQSIDADLKRRWGKLAYLRAGLDVLPDAPRFRCRLDIDGERVEIDAVALLAANGQYAGGLRFVPRARPDDRLLDLAAVTADTLAHRARLIAAFAVGRHLEADDVFYRRARVIRIDCEPVMELHSDGEPIGATPASLRLVPACLSVASPPAGSEQRENGASARR